ncbi:MAG: hypothetical protein ABIB41_01205, partial [Nitrospirota bacterium]
MKKNKLIFLVVACIFWQQIGISSLFALPSDPDIEGKEAGHAGLTKMSIEIKRNLPESEKNGLRDAMGGEEEDKIRAFKYFLSSANVSEDGFPGLRGALHFYDPTTGKGYLGIFPSAKKIANDWYKLAIDDYCYALQNGFSSKSAWADFGHVMHPLQDMTTPPHTNNVSHIVSDSYENYVRDNWDSWQTDAILGYEYNPITGEYDPIKGHLPDEAKIVKNYDSNGNPIYYTGIKEFLETQVNKYDPSKHQLSDISSYIDLLAQISHNSPVDKPKMLPELSKEQISWAERRQNAEKLLPLALLYGAGLINTFWKDISTPTGGIPIICKNKLPEQKGPGGDNPDDRFDVSSEFYFEKYFNMPLDKLVDLNMRTAMKKGKIGVNYLKQAIDVYTKGMTAATDAEREAAEKKLYELGEITIPDSSRFQNDFKTAPDVALFAYGFYNPAISLMLKFKEPVAFMGLDFDPSIVKNHPVMIVP